MRCEAAMQATITTPTSTANRFTALRLAQGVGIEHLKEQIAGTLAELTEG
jgi:hypothetical protein